MKNSMGNFFAKYINICGKNKLYIMQKISTLYRLNTSVVSLVASYQARLLTTWVISVRRRGRTMCFFPREVRNSILAKAGTNSLDKLTFSNMTPFISSCEIQDMKLVFDNKFCSISTRNHIYISIIVFSNWLTFTGFAEDRSFCTAFRASSPPSSWPTITTDENISMQKESSRSTW